MYREHTVGVVVPAYNEEGFIGDVVREMPAFVDRIYVIDDCSTDRTVEEALEAARSDERERTESGWESDARTIVTTEDRFPASLERRAIIHEPIGRVLPIQHRSNRGAGGAILTGYLAAVNDEMEITVTVDGDGQMDLTQMDRLVDPIVAGADYAKGNRLLAPSYRADMPRFRLVGNWILSGLTKIASGYWGISDPQNGYTAISYHALEAVDIEGLYEYYGYCNDLLVKLNVNEMRVADVGIPSIYGEEESGIRYETYIPKVSGMLLRNFLWRLKSRYLVQDVHPLALFYFFGAASTLVGILSRSWSLVTSSRNDQSSNALIEILSSATLLLLGGVSVAFAMLLDRHENRDLEVRIRE